uniref:E3 binding domain-containing protein n=1 Tax=Streptomyces scabiei TaxID=1930 RepID=UPI003BAE1FC0
MTAVFGERPARVPRAHDRRLVGFRSHLRAEVVADDAAYLLSDRGVTALQGDHIEALVPLLDGTRDLPSVLRDAAPAIPPERVGLLIGRLAQAGLVGHATPVPVAALACPDGPVPVISPLVRRLARENGLDLRTLHGSGPEGLILRADVEHALRAATAPATAPASVPEPGRTSSGTGTGPC